MRACVLHGPGDLRVEDVEERQPGAGEVEISVSVGGICGSDLHYFQDGAVGDFRIREPMVLGHEVVGTVGTVGRGASAELTGKRVAVHPATPCGSCEQCSDGRRNTCGDTRYLGSAARYPHVQGGLRERLIVPESQVRVLPADMPLERAVLAEPVAVAMHAVQRAESVRDKRVLVTGAGPIGCLVVAVLRHAGAGGIIVSDLHESALAVAAAVGATCMVPAAEIDDVISAGHVDVAIEAAGSVQALGSCIRCVRPGGTVVVVGMSPSPAPIPTNLLVTREVTLKGSFRFDGEFDQAVALLAEGLEVDPVVTHRFPLDEAPEAFGKAADRTSASKVLLEISTGQGS